MLIDRVKFFTACAERKISFVTVCAMAGVSRSVIVSINNEKAVRSETIGKLAEALKVRPQDLIKEV